MRSATPPIEVCDAWAFKAIPWDAVIKWGLIVSGSVTILAASIGFLMCMWLMPRSAKQ